MRSANEDVQFEPVPIPDPRRPNNILAPSWTDLDGRQAPGILIGKLTDGVGSWTVVEWRVNVFGTNSRRTFQIWVGHNGAQDIQFAYDSQTMAAPGNQPLAVGVESADGTFGGGLPFGAPPTEDLRVTSTDPVISPPVTYTFTVQGTIAGTGKVTTRMTTPVVAGVTEVATPVTIRRR